MRTDSRVGYDGEMVSIIIAVYNGGSTLQRCIDSVISQHYTSKELIVIDGGSSDGTVEILRANNGQIDYWESKSDDGIYDAWNKALDHAHGEWVCFLGSDDYFSQPRSLTTLVSAGCHHIDLVCGRNTVISERDEHSRVVGRAWDWDAMKRFQVVAHPGMLHRRSLFHKHGRFDPSFRIAGDYEFLLRLGPSVEAAFVDDVIACVGAGGVSRTHVWKVLSETRRIQGRHQEIGPVRAMWNHAVAIGKVAARRIALR